MLIAIENIGILAVIFVLLLLVGIVVGYFVQKVMYDKKLRKTKEDIKFLVSNAEKEVESIYDKAALMRKENLKLSDDMRKKMEEERIKLEEQNKLTIIETKKEIAELKRDFEAEAKERRELIAEGEKRVAQREDSIEKRISNLDKREELLTKKELVVVEKVEALEAEKSKAEEIVKEQEKRLENISGLNKEQAEAIIICSVKDELRSWSIQYAKDEEEQAKLRADKVAKQHMVLAMQKFASEVTNDVNISVVNLPTEEMKGRIIGREGRNIRTFETLTGVDLMIDDTPETVVLSCFNPVRRRIAKEALEKLISDGRIHPARIEEVVEKSRNEVNDKIHEMGEYATFNVGISRIHPDLMKLIGSLNFRTSFGQNVLNHSLEVAFIAGKLAAEIGEDENLARRAGLLHDIGKAVDHELDGSHVDIGRDLAKRYKEPKEVIDAISSHHGDCEAETIIGVLVAVADTLSAARPGARKDMLENYTKRLEQLEQITNSFDGIETSYAIQAGREVRIIVRPEEISDDNLYMLSKEIKEKIENEMKYPGTIKVTAIREVRAVETAK